MWKIFFRPNQILTPNQANSPHSPGVMRLNALFRLVTSYGEWDSAQANEQAHKGQEMSRNWGYCSGNWRLLCITRNTRTLPGGKS